MPAECSAPDCTTKAHCKGLCNKHYQRMRHYGTLEVGIISRLGTCSVDGCELKVQCRGMCQGHYTSSRRSAGQLGVCREPDCDRTIAAHGLCLMHYKRRRPSKTKMNQRLRQHYSITLEQYEEILAAQGGVCAIEGCEQSVGDTAGRALQVDHDHNCCPGRSCGKCIRGLLCKRHNRIVGYLEHPDRAAVDRYIASFQTSTTQEVIGG